MSQAESHTNWKILYRVGGTAALIAAALIGVISSYTSGPPPTTVIGWFTLLQNNRFLGLVDLGFFDIAAVALLVPMVLAVYIALRRASASFMAIATTLYFVVPLIVSSSQLSSFIFFSLANFSISCHAERHVMLNVMSC